MSEKDYLDNWFSFDSEPFVIGSQGPFKPKKYDLNTVQKLYEQLRKKHLNRIEISLQQDSNDLYTYDLKGKHKNRVTTIINLEAEWNLKCIRDKLENIYWIPIKNFTAPSIKQIQQFIDIVEKSIEKKVPVIVHCSSGRGRTGTMIAAWLIYKNYFENVSDAIEFIRLQRKGAIESTSQKRSLEKFYLSFHKSKLIN